MKNNRLLYLFIIILVIWNITLTVLLSANKKEDPINQTSVIETNVTGFSTDLTKVIEQSKSSVVVVETNNFVSSGIVYKYIEGKAYIVSSYHGISDDSEIKVTFASGAVYDAKLLGKDIFADLAVLEIDSNVDIIPIKLGDSNIINNGEFMVCIGTPKSTQYANSSGLAFVSSKLRSLNNSIIYNEEPFEYVTNLIQLDANLSQGYSGAPVINMAGETIGIVTMKDDVAYFAMPINEIKYIADNIIDNNDYLKIQFGFRGQFVKDLEVYEKNQLNIPLDVIDGYSIKEVKANSLASKIGLKEQDIILSINEIQIKTYDDLLEAEYKEITDLSFDIIRNNELLTLTGTIND